MPALVRKWAFIMWPVVPWSGRRTMLISNLLFSLYAEGSLLGTLKAL